MKNQRIRSLSNKRRWLTFSIIATIAMLMTGCYYDKAELLYPGAPDCATVSGTFVKVQSIMANKCNSCHNAGSAAGGTVLETYEQVKAKAARINQRVIVEKTMPPGGALSSAEIAILTCWINSGTPNN